MAWGGDRCVLGWGKGRDGCRRFFGYKSKVSRRREKNDSKSRTYIATEVGGLVNFYAQVGLYFANDFSGVVECEVGVLAGRVVSACMQKLGRTRVGKVWGRVVMHLYTWLSEPEGLIVKVEQQRNMGFETNC